jgi:hypothetical protein
VKYKPWTRGRERVCVCVWSYLVGKPEYVNFLLASSLFRKTHVPIAAPLFLHTSLVARTKARNILIFTLTYIQMIVLVTVWPMPLWGGIIRQLIQNNVAGSAENFQVVSWKFDPDVADRRRVEFERKYGVRGQKLIARLGQGEDGYQEERRLRQIERDVEAGYLHANDPN